MGRRQASLGTPVPRTPTLPNEGESPVAIEARNTVELLQMAVAQHAAYSYSREQIHSTLCQSQSYSWRVESPMVSSSERRRNPPRDDNLLDAQAIVDDARARREAAASAQQGAYQQPPVTPSTLVGAGTISRTVGVRVWYRLCVMNVYLRISRVLVKCLTTQLISPLRLGLRVMS